MDKTHPPEAWKRLGERLRERRGELGYGFRQRKQFLEDRGGPNPPSGKMLDRIENGSRSYYPDPTIATLEQIYGYERGSFEAILQGADPVPLPDGPRLAAVPDPAPPIDLTAASDELIGMFIEAWREDTEEDRRLKDMLRRTWILYTVAHGDRDTVIDALAALLHRGVPRRILAEREAQRRARETS